MAHVLIVDDNQLNLELARDILEMDDFDVEIAESGAEGVEKAKQDIPDLVLMDLRMPEMDGLEAMQIIHNDASTCHIPVVVLTASVMKGEQDRLMEAGFDAFLQKPIDPSSFADEVSGLLNCRKVQEVEQ